MYKRNLTTKQKIAYELTWILLMFSIAFSGFCSMLGLAWSISKLEQSPWLFLAGVAITIICVRVTMLAVSAFGKHNKRK